MLSASFESQVVESLTSNQTFPLLTSNNMYQEENNLTDLFWHCSYVGEAFSEDDWYFASSTTESRSTTVKGCVSTPKDNHMSKEFW